LLSIGIIGAIWAGSSGVAGIMKTTNRAYEVRETRPMWKRLGLAVGMTVFGGFAIITAFVLLVGGQVAGLAVADQIGLEGVAASLFTLARWPIVISLLITAVAVLYWAAPNVDLPFRWITPGAIVFTVGWLAASYGFGIYVHNFGSYSVTYGTLGGVVVLLIWFYLTGFILLLGAEINAITAQEVVPEELPQTEEEGATPDTIPPHRRGEAQAKRPLVREPEGSTLTAEQPPRRNGSAARTQPSGKTGVPALADGHGARTTPRLPAGVVAVFGLLLGMLTFWRLARGDAVRA
jgi:YihY family inner membrane protein